VIVRRNYLARSIVNANHSVIQPARKRLAKSWARSDNFHEAEVKLRAAILSYFPSKDGRPSFLERFELTSVLAPLDHIASFIDVLKKLGE